MKLRLHTRYQNSAGQRVRIVLNLKGLPYEYLPIPSLSSAAYGDINPQRLMPALEIAGRIVAQSMAIVVGRALSSAKHYSCEPAARAEVRSFSHHISSDLHPINNNRVRRYLSDIIGTDKAKVSGWYSH